MLLGFTEMHQILFVRDTGRAQRISSCIGVTVCGLFISAGGPRGRLKIPASAFWGRASRERVRPASPHPHVEN